MSAPVCDRVKRPSSVVGDFDAACAAHAKRRPAGFLDHPGNRWRHQTARLFSLLTPHYLQIEPSPDLRWFRCVYNAPMDPLSVLFICIGNTCRSPLAEAIARGNAGDELTAASAGLMPFGRIVPATVRTLEALGYDPTGLASKGLEEVDLPSFDVIISLLGPSGLTYLPRTLPAELLSWSIHDPYGEDDEVYMSVARDLERRIRRLVADQQKRELSLF